ncbi:MAG: DUF3617 family protein [Nitrospira sp.]|nr:DUF3617 family protein [Nitrospira sp.]
MGKKICILLFIISLFLLLGITFAGGTNIKEGLWEITMKMEMQGMPMQMPPQTYTHCITKKDMVPQKEEPGQECKMVKSETKGDTVSWVMECKTREGTVTNNGRVTYKRDTFEGVVKVSMPGGKRGGMEMTQHMKGRWIGQCR